MYRFRQEFIPLALNKRDNTIIEDCSITPESNDTIDDDNYEDFLETETVEQKDFEEWIVEEKRKDEWMEKIKKRDELKKRFDPSMAYRLVRSIEHNFLNDEKIQLLTHKKLTPHPHLQEGLIHRIKDKSDKEAERIILQSIHDLETGYIKKDGNSYSVENYDAKDVIRERNMIVKILDRLILILLDQ